nr:MAG TPA: hypothetical protein [Caudoviricetes sp.]
MCNGYRTKDLSSAKRINTRYHRFTNSHSRQFYSRHTDGKSNN